MSKIKLEDNAEGVRRSIRDVQPTHYTFKIQSFSLLSKSSIERYESADFEAGGYNWKLALYPNGNEKKNGKDHISLYLVMAETSSLPPGWEVNFFFKLFLFDQIRDNYLTLEDTDGKVKRFHGMKTECGFSQFVSLATFNNPSNGYLIDDTCIFGAEVFVCKSTGKGECLSMVKDAITCSHSWKIENFSMLKEEYLRSEVFIAGDHKWEIKLYPRGPRGNLDGKNNCLSMYLRLANSDADTPGRKVFTNCSLRIRNKNLDEHIQRTSSTDRWFASEQRWGWTRFMKLDDLNDPAKGFLDKDTCIVEAEVTVLGFVNKFP